MMFTGFDDWVEIFRGGRQIDSAGNAHDGDALIDKAVSGFNAAEHEPPVVIGHPKDNAPAFAWVAGLKKSVKDGGAVLLAKFRDVVPEFEDLARRGLYKKRSAAFYPDGRLRHVGFLGSSPPAVKGLADIGFVEENQTTFEFGEPSPWIWSSLSQMLRSLRDWLIEKEGKDTADSVLPSWNIEELEREARRAAEPDDAVYREKTLPKGDAKMKFSEFMEIFKFWKQVEADPSLELSPPAAKPADSGKTFSESDVETAKKEAAAAEREKLTKEFAEKQLQAARDARGREIDAWCDKNLADGKIAPSWVKSGLKEFCRQLDAEGELTFGEKDQKATPLAWFQEFVAGLPKLVEFSEIAKRDADVGAGSAGEKLSALVQKKLAADKTLGYSAAFSEVQREHPDLAAEYAAELNAG